MSELSKIKTTLSSQQAAWLIDGKPKYRIQDIRAGTGTPLEQALIGWSQGIAKQIKANIRKTKSQATRALYQSVGALPIFGRDSNMVSRIVAEEYIDYIEQGVSGLERKVAGTPFKFRSRSVSKEMQEQLSTHIAAKPISLSPKPGQTKKDLNKQVAYAMGVNLKKYGIKPRKLYGYMVEENSEQQKELRQIVSKQVGAAFAAEIVGAYTGKQ
jgi:hypothetical protein